MGAQPEAKDPAVHVRDVELVTLALVAVEGEAEQAHVRVLGRVDDRRVDQAAVLVVGEDAFVIGVLVTREEVAGARRDVHATVLVDGDAEWMAGRRRAREDAHVTDRRPFGCSRERRIAGPERESADDRHGPDPSQP